MRVYFILVYKVVINLFIRNAHKVKKILQYSDHLKVKLKMIVQDT